MVTRLPSAWIVGKVLTYHRMGESQCLGCVSLAYPYIAFSFQDSGSFCWWDWGIMYPGVVEKKKDHLVRWDQVCQPKAEGCLGLGLLVSKNIPLVRKWLWRFPWKPRTLCNRIIESNYGVQRNGWDSQVVWFLLMHGLGNFRFLLYSSLLLSSRWVMAQSSDFGRMF